MALPLRCAASLRLAGGDPSFHSGLQPATVKDRFGLMGHVSASPRLAAHRSGRAITAVASKVDRSTCGVKYVAQKNLVMKLSHT